MDPSPTGDRWAVGLAPRALKELQKFKKDRSSLDIVWDKIKELSHGRFVQENHSAIIGTTSKIPIYVARLDNDLRMVYHIDIVADKMKEILRIDARAHIDYNLWVRVSSYLFREYDNEYRKRCVYHQSTISSKSYACLPFKFPHNARASNLIQPEDAEERGVDEVSGKYVAATKSLYNSILANKRAADTTEGAGTEVPPKILQPLGRIRLPPDPDPCQNEIINHRGASIVIGRSGTGKTTALIYKMHAIDQSATTPIRQMFVTRSRVLARHVESSFGRLVDSINMESEAAEELGEKSKDLDQALVEFDNEVDLRTDLPSRFSLLDKSHFPLFISFDKLCSLLEADIYEEQKTEKREVWSARPMWKRNIIGFKEFKEVYWPQLKDSLRSGLNPSLVYSEVVGVIKGYSETLGCTNGYLSLDQYLGGTAHKVSAHLDESTKKQIYLIFGEYRRIKGTRFELDHADRCHYILEMFKQKESHQSPDEVHKRQLHCLYVDEVQDNLMTDIRMLRRLCGSIDNTYWGGDTAQTIAYDTSAHASDDTSTHTSDCQQCSSSSPPSKFELTINYRSHEGIVRCAASIVDVLYNLFPESLDRLPRETADDKSTEHPPIIFTDTSSQVSLFEDFLLRSSSSLGAQQAVLVKSEEIAEQLSSRISEFCPILTIADSKGLEFDDIILYNFFSESDCEEAWDFVHGYPMKAHSNARDLIPPLSLCNELKLLYVALTRAQKRCWIWDHGYVIDAMKKFWEVQGLVVTKSITNMIRWGSNTSNSTQWIAKGQEYFANGMYKLAAGCFKRGGNEATSSYRIAMAYYQMSRAKIEMLRVTRRKAELGQCAAQAQGQSARHLWFHTAICLELAHDILESADAFVNAGLYERAIRTLLDRSYVKRSVKILLEHGHNLEARTKEEFLNYCRKYYFEKHALEALSPLFDSIEDELLYARKHAYWEQLKQLLEFHERFDELARVHLDDRAISKGLDWFLHAYNHHRTVSSLNEAASVVIRHAEWTLPLEGKRSVQALEQLDMMIDKVAVSQAKLKPTVRKELNVYRVIRKGGSKLVMINDWNQTVPEESLRKAWILHGILQDMGWLNSRFVGDVVARLNAWNSYNSIISKIVQALEPSKIIAAQHLFGFKPTSSEFYASPYCIVAEGSLVAESAHKYPFTTQRNSYNELLVPARWVDKIMKDELRRRLHDGLRKIYHGLRSGWTSPLAFNPRVIQTNKLSRPITRAISSDKGFKNRFNVVNLAIEAFAPVCHIPFEVKSSLANPGLVQLWVRRLFDTVYPFTGTFEEIPDSRVRKGQPKYPGVRACIQQYLVEASSLSVDLSTYIIANSLSLQLKPHDVSIDVRPSTCDNPSSSENQLLEKRMVDSFFDLEDPNGLTVVVLGLSTTGRRGYVHLIEMITCEFLYHKRVAHPGCQNGFSGLILPYSWARLLIKRYARSPIICDASSLDTLLEVLTVISDELKGSNPRWWVAEELLSKKREITHILQLRLCWCISLLLVNSKPDGPLGFGDTLIYSLIHIAGHMYEQEREPLYRRFNMVMDQKSCLETLVRLSYKRETPPAWQDRADILTVSFAESNSLINSLQKCLR
ncbi:hypothetical protein B0J17DRAFT_657189 [Rhizoctonia solani]|nr:hypothetical protein B0J17DRAFT_657189 [Rhizoctonia solani]